MEKLHAIRMQYQVAVQKARKACHVDLGDLASAGLPSDRAAVHGILDPSKLHDEPTYDMATCNPSNIPILELRHPIMPEGMLTFEKAGQQEKEMILNEMHASHTPAVKTAVEVNACAHIMKEVIETCNAQIIAERKCGIRQRGSSLYKFRTIANYSEKAS